METRLVGFLVVTALPEEAEAVRALLDSFDADSQIGAVARQGGGKVKVRLLEIRGMGPIRAMHAIQEEIARSRPDRVLMAGIAAGFPESGADLGDVLIPERLVNYEHQKVRESRSLLRRILPSKHAVEYRAYPERVSVPLWNAALKLAQAKDHWWKQRLDMPRPDGRREPPNVHIESGTVLGNGEKVVADERYYARKWLLERFGKNALGLEMEGGGLAEACLGSETPYLLIKSVSDAATGSKGSSQSEAWRPYACASAAAFAIELISRFSAEGVNLVMSAVARAERQAELFRSRAKQPLFPHRLRVYGNYAQFVGQHFQQSSAPIEAALPNAEHRFVALHGGGGAGKSRVLRHIFKDALQEKVLPILIGLRASLERVRLDDSNLTRRAKVSRIVAEASAPSVSLEELEYLGQQVQLVIFVDGLNEISREDQGDLIETLRTIGVDHRPCWLLASSRHVWSEALPGFRHVELQELDDEAVEGLYTRRFPGTYTRLTQPAKEILKRPFFLDLVLERGITAEGITQWSDFFERFFTSDHMRMTHAQLDELAEAVLECLEAHGVRFSSACLEERVGSLYSALREAHVIRWDGEVFVHDLWRDYLCSRALANMQEGWKPYLNRATLGASAIEALKMVVQQLPDSDRTSDFLKTVYDWNYGAAAEILASAPKDPDHSRVPYEIEVAIVASLADKRWDRVRRTARRFEEIFRHAEYSLAEEFGAFQERDEMVGRIQGISSDVDWFATWKEVFSITTGAQINQDVAAGITSDDPLIGWAWANTLRRAALSEQQRSLLRREYSARVANQASATVRWRIVHALGCSPTEPVVDLLEEAMHSDDYEWVRYGAARALMEIAASAGPRIREKAFSAILAGMERLGEPRWVQRQVAGEIVEVADIGSPPPDWRESVRPVLTKVVQMLPPAEGTTRVLQERLRDFNHE